MENLELKDAAEVFELRPPGLAEPITEELVVGLEDPDMISIVPTLDEVLLSVVICAAGIVTLLNETPLAVYAQRQRGSFVRIQSAVVCGPYDALAYEANVPGN
jgi:hypothetical protein